MKLFCVSDIHSFYDEFRKALGAAGFDENDPNHMLIVCGDVWDRGPKPKEVMDYLMSLERVKLIAGNHEDLFIECCNQSYPNDYDWDNGTIGTILTLGNYNGRQSFNVCATRAFIVASEFLAKFINYYETEHYVFVHSFVPLFVDKSHYTKDRNWNPDWRNASYDEWDPARWGNPFELAEKFWQEDKTLVFGHWHTSWARHNYHWEPEFGEWAVFDPYCGKNYIGIDGCTAASGQVNVLVLEDELLEG